MAVKRIPFFRIPFLALRIILESYSVCDIIQLSLCSKRSLQVAKTCWKKKGSVNASLYAEKNPRINLSYLTTCDYTFWIYSAEELKDHQTHNIRVSDSVVPSIHKGNETGIFWYDKFFGIERIARYIRDLFDEPITKIELKHEEYPNEFIRIFDCIMSRQESVKTVAFHYYMNPMEDCLTHLLDNCKITGNLWIYGGPTRQFRNDWNIHLDGIYMSNSLSFTFQNLMNIDCHYLQLLLSSLTNEDLNQFLKHWQNGGNSRIKFVSIVVSSCAPCFNEEIITSGIDTVSQRLRRCYQGVNNSKVEMYGGLDIRRNDGTIGTIFSDYKTFKFGVDPEVFRRPD